MNYELKREQRLRPKLNGYNVVTLYSSTIFYINVYLIMDFHMYVELLLQDPYISINWISISIWYQLILCYAQETDMLPVD